MYFLSFPSFFFFFFFSFPFLLTYTYIVPLARPYCFFFKGGEGVRVVAPVTQLITYRSPIRDGLSGGFQFLSLFPHFPHVARFSSLVPSQSTRRFCSFRRDCECFLSPLSGSSFLFHRERRSVSVGQELIKRALVFHFFFEQKRRVDCEGTSV